MTRLRSYASAFLRLCILVGTGSFVVGVGIAAMLTCALLLVG
ncbi:hypothetical protein [Pseudonocardia sp. N23]|nr:hypothetical protein [Pseudonocardia sp. N23]GAY10934.1 hypothetical protein TOK_5419 [Pseudonocardia sp. N23]